MYGNNSLTYVWVDGTTCYCGQTYGNLGKTTIDDGFYDITKLNEVLQAAQYANGQFLIDPNGTYVYYLVLRTNDPYYAVELDSTNIPTATQWNTAVTGLAALGWKLPGWGWGASNGGSYPTIVAGRYRPQLIVPTSMNVTPTSQIVNNQNPYFNTNTIAGILGFSPATYPSDATVQAPFAFLSTNFTGNPAGYPASFTPEVSPVLSILVTTNLLSNGAFSTLPNVIGQVVPMVDNGAPLQYQPAQLQWNDIPTGLKQSNCRLDLLDQNFRPLSLQDPQITATVLIRDQTSTNTFTGFKNKT